MSPKIIKRNRAGATDCDKTAKNRSVNKDDETAAKAYCDTSEQKIGKIGIWCLLKTETDNIGKPYLTKLAVFFVDLFNFQCILKLSLTMKIIPKMSEMHIKKVLKARKPRMAC